MSLRYQGGVLSTVPPTTSTSTAVGVWTMRQQMQAQGANSWPSPPQPDAQFNYVTMLLTGDGTNGAQNNTFLDGSTNNFTITRNGNTTQGSFSPYGSNWSNYFNGSTDYLTVSGAANFGSGDATVEFWFYPTTTAATYFCISDGRSSVNTDTGFAIFQYGQTIEVYGNGLKVATAASAFSANTWVYIALVRTSGTCQLYVNGVASGSSGSYSNSFTNTARTVALSVSSSYPFAGYLSNYRETTSALYGANFTPSTVPLTSGAGTARLICNTNNFGANVTPSGTPSVQRFNPFGASTAYSTATIGGSGYFDQTGDYLELANNTALNMESGDFTVEFWINFISLASYQTPYAKGYNGTGDLAIQTGAGTGRMVVVASGSVVITESGTANLNEWIHYALVRSGSTLTMYRNGVSSGSATVTTNFSSSTVLGVGGAASHSTKYAINGYMSDVRVVKGTAVYTTTFTPPTAPLTAISGTSLLCSMTNGAIFDNAMMNDLETVGNAQISTSVKKYGTGSMYFDGSGDQLNIRANPDTALGTGDFTVEYWVYTTSFYDYETHISSTRGANGFNCGTQSAAQLVWYANGAERVRGTTVMSTNTWYHVAYVRYNGVLKGYLNGVQNGTTYTDPINYSTPIIVIGNLNTGGEPTSGYIDDLRITKGYARYTANFTPPTQAFPLLGPE